MCLPPPCVCPLRGPTLCMSPPCIHSTVCTLHHVYVSLYVCSLMCISLQCRCPLRVDAPSVCMSLRMFVPSSVSGCPSVCLVLHVYIPLCVFLHVYIFLYDGSSICISPPCICPSLYMSPPCGSPTVSMYDREYTTPYVRSNICPLHPMYVSPCSVSTMCISRLCMCVSFAVFMSPPHVLCTLHRV